MGIDKPFGSYFFQVPATQITLAKVIVSDAVNGKHLYESTQLTVATD